jgi:hypothetical protein
MPGLVNFWLRQVMAWYNRVASNVPKKWLNRMNTVCPSYLVYAAAIVTCELPITTRSWGGTVVQRHILICAIYTIRITITQPLTWYALRSVPHLVFFASEFCFLITRSSICKYLINN